MEDQYTITTINQRETEDIDLEIQKYLGPGIYSRMSETLTFEDLGIKLIIQDTGYDSYRIFLEEPVQFIIDFHRLSELKFICKYILVETYEYYNK